MSPQQSDPLDHDTTQGSHKHDADCLRRKRHDGWLYLCTCGMTDPEVIAAIGTKDRR